MKTRHVVAMAAALITGLAGCSSPPSALGNPTARVSIDGQDAGGVHVVTCSQTGWAWTIESLNSDNGFTAVVDTGDAVKPRSVTFNNLGGFTGNYWADKIGNAQVSAQGGAIKITGSAAGNYTDQPSKAVNASFSIDAHC